MSEYFKFFDLCKDIQLLILRYIFRFTYPVSIPQCIDVVRYRGLTEGPCRVIGSNPHKDYISFKSTCTTAVKLCNYYENLPFEWRDNILMVEPEMKLYFSDVKIEDNVESEDYGVIRNKHTQLNVKFYRAYIKICVLGTVFTNLAHMDTDTLASIQNFLIIPPRYFNEGVFDDWNDLKYAVLQNCIPVYTGTVINVNNYYMPALLSSASNWDLLERWFDAREKEGIEITSNNYDIGCVYCDAVYHRNMKCIKMCEKYENKIYSGYDTVWGNIYRSLILDERYDIIEHLFKRGNILPTTFDSGSSTPFTGAEVKRLIEISEMVWDKDPTPEGINPLMVPSGTANISSTELQKLMSQFTDDANCMSSILESIKSGKKYRDLTFKINLSVEEADMIYKARLNKL